MLGQGRASRTSDTGSDTSLVVRLKNKLKKPKPVQPTDFDELFARGMAKSAELESSGNRDPFTAKVFSNSGIY